MNKIYYIDPTPAPRQSRRDKWDPSEAVQRYRAFKDLVKIHAVDVKPSRQHIIFHVAMPKSWSKKKRHIFNGQPHTHKPDVDNLLKALLDAIFGDDAHIWDIRASKLWAEQGMIVIEEIE